MSRYWPLAMLLLSAACQKTLQAQTTQPNPLKYPAEVERRSERLVIHTKDMELPRSMLLQQAAYFQVVSRDRLRFHVRLTHKWEEYTNIKNWDVYLEDDKGRRYTPDETDLSKNKLITRMIDKEIQTATWNRYGDRVSTKDDGYRNRTVLTSLDVFKGVGDYSFHGRDIFTRDLRWLTLVMEKGGVEYRFTWKFSDDPAEWREFRPAERESGDYEDDFETAALCYDPTGKPLPFNGGCITGSDPGYGR